MPRRPPSGPGMEIPHATSVRPLRRAVDDLDLLKMLEGLAREDDGMSEGFATKATEPYLSQIPHGHRGLRDAR